jgi:hypothetical protein
MAIPVPKALRFDREPSSFAASLNLGGLTLLSAFGIEAEEPARDSARPNTL